MIHLKKIILFLTLCGALEILVTSCSVQGKGIPSNLTNATVILSNVEKEMSSAISQNVPVQPCQGVPESGVMWPKEFMYACSIYDSSGFNTGFSGEGVTQSSPYHCDYDAYTSARTGLSSTGYYNLLKEYVDSKLTQPPKKSVYTVYDEAYNPINMKGNVVSPRDTFRQDFFNMIAGVSARINHVNYLISFGNKFEIKTGTGGVKYLKLNTPIERDSSDPSSIVGMTGQLEDATNDLPGIAPLFNGAYLSGLHGAPRPEVESDFKYLPLDYDSQGLAGANPTALVFNLTSPGVNNFYRRFIYPVVLTISDYLPMSPYSNDEQLSLSITVGRFLCSFVIKDKFYKIKKLDFSVFTKTFAVDVDQLTTDGNGNITLAVPTLYYQTEFKPRTVIIGNADYFATGNNGNYTLVPGYTNYNTKSTGMNEGIDFTTAELDSPASEETSFANIFEKKENGSTIKALPTGMQETASL